MSQISVQSHSQLHKSQFHNLTISQSHNFTLHSIIIVITSHRPKSIKFVNNCTISDEMTHVIILDRCAPGIEEEVEVLDFVDSLSFQLVQEGLNHSLIVEIH